MKPKQIASYDYADLARQPKVLGFFLGWFGQELLFHTHFARSQRNFYQPSSGRLDCWELCRRESCRLLEMLLAYCQADEAIAPKDLLHSLHYLIDEYGPEGYQVSLQAGQERLELKEDRYELNPADWHEHPRRIFPDVRVIDTTAPGRFGDLCARLTRTVARFAEILEEVSAVEQGAGLACTVMSFSQGDPIQYAKIYAHNIVTIGLLSGEDALPKLLRGQLNPYVPGWDPFDPEKAFEALVEAVYAVPGAICSHFNLPCPPLDADALSTFFPPRDENPSNIAQRTATSIDLTLGLPEECLDRWCRPWQEDPDYMPLAKANKTFFGTKYALTNWSGWIRRPGAHVRYMIKNSRRTYVHVGDLIAYEKRLKDRLPEKFE